jgi:hypothetical protein
LSGVAGKHDLIRFQSTASTSSPGQHLYCSTEPQGARLVAPHLNAAQRRLVVLFILPWPHAKAAQFRHQSPLVVELGALLEGESGAIVGKPIHLGVCSNVFAAI